MLIKAVLFLFLFCLLAKASTRVRINNYCPQTLTITESINGNINVLCKPKSGSSCYKDYTLFKTWAYYQPGWYFNGTFVKVDFNEDSMDYYSIWAGTFDLSVKVSSNNGGVTLVCMDKYCPDNYESVTGNAGKSKVGGIITIDWCPLDSLKKGLTLVETVHNPEIINSIKHPRMRRGNKRMN